MGLLVAIDGPVGAGKSRVASQVAAALGILHLDTGAMYRALALKTLLKGIAPDDVATVCELCEKTEIDVRLSGGGQRTLLDGEDVTDRIRTPEVSQVSSAISVLPEVRAHMLALQRKHAASADMVLDGRDIGTHVLPDAPHKFFLTATPEIRARRRYLQNVMEGDKTPYEDVLAELLIRDKRDMEREVAPLRQAEDAHLVDTSSMEEAEVVAELLSIIREQPV